MTNILIPMAGKGQRFVDAGYKLPKPLIDVAGKPMIQRVIESLNIQGQYIFCVLQEHEEKYKVSDLLLSLCPDCKILYVDNITQGAVCTCLLASDLIDSDEPLVIANSDQIVSFDSHLFLKNIIKYDGCIVTFQANHPKWSYVLKNINGFVEKVVEKRVISIEANVGIYGFCNGYDFIGAAELMMMDDTKRVNREWYIAPVYNEIIDVGGKVTTIQAKLMLPCGDPESLTETLLKLTGK